jgi:hypothetical protein
MKIVAALGAICLLGVLHSVASAEEVTIQNAPPVVVKTVPEAGTNDVDPALAEIKVTFSKEMKNGSWSWSTAWQNSTPESPKDTTPKYLDDKRTCVLQVKLQPDKVYGFWLNSENYRNFKDADGKPAVPYLLVFKTKNTTASQTKPQIEYPVALPDKVKKPPTFIEPLDK